MTLCNFDVTCVRLRHFSETGRGKLSGVHAGVVILTPLGDAIPSESHHYTGSTPLEPPPTLINSVYSALKNVFSSAAPLQDTYADYVPPPPQPFRPMSWGAVNSYGEPATADSYIDYSPYPPLEYASSKKSVITPHREGLTAAKIQKINANLEKLNAYMNENQRSSEVLPRLNKDYAEMLRKGVIPLMPTPVVSDNEIGVLPAELLPDPLSSTSTTTTTTTSQPSKNTTENENIRRKKDVKYILRGNKIVQLTTD